MTSGFTQFSAVVGRRAALRYGTIGIGAAAIALLTGCGSTSPAAATMAAFAKGTWHVTAKGQSTTFTVTDGSWSATSGGLFGTDNNSGTWSLAGSTLSVQRAGFEDTTGQCVGTNLPGSVGGSVDQTIGWIAPQFNIQMPMSWDGTTLTMTGTTSIDSKITPMVITATRH